jgi:sugar/nucleoside kinase (ribokinase family)
MPAPPPDIVSIGDATVDVFLRIHDASVHCQLDHQQCLLCLRYADKIPVEDVQQVKAAGNAANNAVGSARLSLRAALVATVGADAAGRGIITELRRNRVGVSAITVDRRYPTNYSTVLNFKSERTILVYHAPRTYRLPPLPPARMVYLTSMGENWERIIPSLRRSLRKNGTLLSFNPGTYQLRAAPAALARIFTVTDALLVNREEAAHLLRVPPRTHPRKLLRGLRALGPRLVVITDGPAGSTAFHDRDMWIMPAGPSKAVERTGAGDAFGTGFLAALLHGKGVADGLRWGTLNEDSVVKYVGPQKGLLTLSQMKQTLARYPKVVARPL